MEGCIAQYRFKNRLRVTIKYAAAMENRNKKNKFLAGGTLIVSGILLGGTVSASTIFETESLGTGSQVRTHLLKSERAIDNCLEMTCGESSSSEASCGEASCGEASCGEATSETSSTEASCGEANPETATTEASCGESSETPSTEHKCGEDSMGI